MKTLLFLVLVSLLGSCGTTAVPAALKELPLVPRPLAETVTAARVTFGPRVAVLFTPPSEPSAREYVASLRNFPWLTVATGEAAGADTVVRLAPLEGEGVPGSYRVTAAPSPGQGPAAVTIQARDPDGFFYGLQTLVQLVRTGGPGSPTLPLAEITDAPRYPWRGSMLDSARHFIPADYIKRHLSLMAELKMNVFHWHLTDDQGWRFEVPGYPKLTSVGAWRSKSGPNGHEQGVPLDDRKLYGGFYTEDQIRDIVAYATTLHIAILPEVDMPGHSGAAIASYPDLGCTGPGAPALAEPESGWGVFPYTLNPAKEADLTFVTAVTAQLVKLFPYPYIHIGGDEVSDISAWGSDPDCRAVMTREKYSDPRRLEGYFHKKVWEILTRAGRTPVGWEDVVGGYQDQGIQPPTVLQFWSRPDNLRTGLARGHRFIFSPYTEAYLDMTYGPGEPRFWAGYISLEDTYGLDPAAWTDKASQVLGVEGLLWTERTPTTDAMDDKVWPRLVAVAEAGWTAPDRRDWSGFTLRLPAFARHLQALGVNFRRCDGVNWETR